MNSLLEKEGMAGKVQMIYIDPPYGIKYGSNFQPFVNKRDVKDGKDEDLTAEPEQIRAFRDTWELSIHSYLTYLRDRLLLARELLTESGSIFVQISDENVHRVRCLMDEVFGAGNFVSLITFRKTTGVQSRYVASVSDYLIWYAKDKQKGKFRNLFREKTIDENYNYVLLPNGEKRKLLKEEFEGRREIPKGGRIFRYDHLLSSGPSNQNQDFIFEGKKFTPPPGNHWKTSVEGLQNLAKNGRIVVKGNTLNYIRFFSDFAVYPYTNFWDDTTTGGDTEKIYVVQTTFKVIERCILMTTDPGDLVFDPTCVRKGTRVWRVGSPPVVPPHAGGQGTTSQSARGQNAPSPFTGRVGEGLLSPFTGRVGEGLLSPFTGRVGEGLSLVPIESIHPGDWVLAHDGLPHRVLHVIRRAYKGKMVGIRHNLCDQTLWLTADHRLLAHKRPHSLGGHADWSGIPKPLHGHSKDLRKAMTPPERKLWAVLRGNSTGFTFRRQHPIGRYIADFYCREAALVVEVDGAVAHSTPDAIAHDRVRDEILRSLNLKVIRFPAAEVEHNLEGVYTAIQEACWAQQSPEHAAWIEAERIEKGDVLFYGPDRTPARVVKVIEAFSEEEVYDLEVEEAHSFITEVCAVHNCGSGTTAYVAEQWGRRWITCDTSRVALAIARQRLMTAVFDYYELAYPENPSPHPSPAGRGGEKNPLAGEGSQKNPLPVGEGGRRPGEGTQGVWNGFKYKTVPHVTLKSIANNPEIDGIYTRMHPAIEKALADINAALKSLTPAPSPGGNLPSPQPSPSGRGSEENPLPWGRSEENPLPWGRSEENPLPWGRSEENPLPQGEGGRRPGEGYPRFKVTNGGRAGEFVDFAAPDSATFTMPSGQVVKVNELVEWEVPFEFPVDWPEAARKPFEAFHAARRAMQKAMDEAIARHAPQETLYDQPLIDRKKVRVTGPFTVEAVPAPTVKSVEELLPSPPGRGVGGEGKKPLDPELLAFVRKLRKEQTDAERLMWSLLCDRRLTGFKFRRQHLIEPYVLDFYCHEARLAIELDGGQHNQLDEQARDAKRDAFLEQQGIRVLRFWNSDVLQNTEGVLQAIHDALTPTLSQRERELEIGVSQRERELEIGVSQREREFEVGVSQREREFEAGVSQREREFAADASIARSGETLRQGEWRDELLRTGIRGKAGQYIRFARLEPLPGCRWLHADGETRPSDEGADSVRETGPAYSPMRIVVSFGPEHAPLEQRQVAQAIEEAQTLVPKPRLIVFAAFQFDPEAAKDIDETNWPGVTLLKAQMNADLLTDDLKKKRASNESFWLIGQPDVEVECIAPSPQPSPSGRGSKGVGALYRVSVHGFDYYNTKTGQIESGGADKIAVWMLDTDYDGRSLYPRQVFFPMAGENKGWARLAKNLKAEIDEERIEAYRGTVSLPFEPGEHRRIAVKIVDDRGIESLKVMDLPG